MTTTDKHLFKIIWGLFFLILALPVFAPNPTALFTSVVDSKHKAAHLSQARTINLVWLDKYLLKFGDKNS